MSTLSRNKRCSFRFLSFGSRIQSCIDISGTDEAVDMAMVYRQSLFSPMYGALNFRTPAFKANKNRYKMVGRSSWQQERYFQFLLLNSAMNWEMCCYVIASRTHLTLVFTGPSFSIKVTPHETLHLQSCIFGKNLPVSLKWFPRDLSGLGIALRMGSIFKI